MAERKLTSILRQPSSQEISSDADLKALGLKPKAIEEIKNIGMKSRVNILSDQPAKEDSLGIDALVRTLANGESIPPRNRSERSNSHLGLSVGSVVWQALWQLI